MTLKSHLSLSMEDDEKVGESMREDCLILSQARREPYNPLHWGVGAKFRFHT